MPWHGAARPLGSKRTGGTAWRTGPGATFESSNVAGTKIFIRTDIGSQKCNKLLSEYFEEKISMVPLASRSELLHAVLAADLVDFHTYDYARHFVSACTRILGLEGTPEGVEDQGRLTCVAAFPIGIDSERFIRALEVHPVQEHIKELQERFAGKMFVMLGVDRLNMIKGIPHKILVKKFLEENPYWRGKVVLLQIAVPTRTDVPEYQNLTSQVHEIVGRINGRFETLHAVLIHNLIRNNWLCLLYFYLTLFVFLPIAFILNVALVISLRDGMNLVSYEFVACQDLKKGVLILSEFAGAAQSLGAGAVLVNPWNITEVASAIGQALNMPAEEREKRHRPNFEHHRAPINLLCRRFKELQLKTLFLLYLPERNWVQTRSRKSLKVITRFRHNEQRETSLFWNYKYVDVEFGRLQARDVLQHLWTGPISNSSVDVVQGSRSVEVRAVGVTKGAAIDRILGEIVHSKAICTPIDYVLCIGHFIGKDEDVYTFFEPELHPDSTGAPSAKMTDTTKVAANEKRPSSKLPSGRSSPKLQGKSQQHGSSSDNKSTSGSSK
ncbi:hypothetical protein ACJIZ3_011252 [Penstemon smallii]|uniref:Trehalose-6-phosphate synthase n=1 Tax=Penstemon smallii TaxID=265156 RepID=A0ABD3UM52_9LAMI